MAGVGGLVEAGGGASKAWMPRKSRCSAPGGTEQRCQRKPSSSVRTTVPLVPEAQATPLPTLSMPRRSAVVGGVAMSNWARAEEKRGQKIIASVASRQQMDLAAGEVRLLDDGFMTFNPSPVL